MTPRTEVEQSRSYALCVEVGSDRPGAESVPALVVVIVATFIDPAHQRPLQLHAAAHRDSAPRPPLTRTW